MPATPLSPENQRELAALRARAYGPSADIDPRGLARLTELEGMARPDAAPSASAEPARTADGPTAQPVGTPQPVQRWRRRVPVSTLVVAAAVLGLGIGLVAPGLLPPHPYAVLSAAPTDGRVPRFSTSGELVGSPTHYEKFHDLDVWSARTTEGAVCVLVVSADTTWRAAGCAPRPLDPVAEVSPYPVIRAIEGLDLPTGSLIRFILHEGRVQVWIDEGAEKS
ncbi:MAG: hypothetical protein ABWZ16_10735 [Microbacterium sp.]